MARDSSGVVGMFEDALHRAHVFDPGPDAAIWMKVDLAAEVVGACMKCIDAEAALKCIETLCEGAVADCDCQLTPDVVAKQNALGKNVEHAINNCERIL